MNFDNVKYLFQLPLEWFKGINDRVYKMFGTNFLTVREDQDGGTELGVDEEAFAQMVQQYAPQGGGDVKSVDGVLPDANGDVNFGLAASKWMKTDAQGHLATTNDEPVTLNRQQYTPQTTTLTAVTDVTWNGTTLKYSSKQLQFVNGVLTQATTLADQTIDTPYQITWS